MPTGRNLGLQNSMFKIMLTWHQMKVIDHAVTGHMYHSISKKPLFPLCAGVDHIVPPSLHILLGLVVRFFSLLEIECHKLDQVGLEERDLEQNAEWLTVSEQAKELEVEVSEARSALVV